MGGTHYVQKLLCTQPLLTVAPAGLPRVTCWLCRSSRARRYTATADHILPKEMQSATDMRRVGTLHVPKGACVAPCSCVLPGRASGGLAKDGARFLPLQ